MAAVTCKTQRKGRTYSLESVLDSLFELFLEEETSIVAKKINCGLPSLFYCYANS